MADARDTGERVLAGLEKGRLRAVASQRRIGEQNERAVRRALDLDLIAGRPAWGRNTRIGRAVQLTPQAVGKILKRLSSCFDSAEPNAATKTSETA